MIDLYATLGIKRDATRIQIRSAYRKLSKKYHPDMEDGDAEMFAAVAQAHEVLTDDRQKAHYDRTGEFLGKTPEGNPDAEMYNFITQCVVQAIAQLVDYPGFDLMKSLKEVIQNSRQTLLGQQREQTAYKAKLDKARARIKTKQDGTDNLLEKLVNSQISQIDGQLSTINVKLGQMKRADEFIDAYTYDVDKSASQYSGPLGLMDQLINDQLLR